VSGTDPAAPCGDAEAREGLEALFLGTLGPREAERLRAHATGCAACREAYDRLSRVQSALEGRTLPRAHEALLEASLFARLGVPRPQAAGEAPAAAVAGGREGAARRRARPRWAVPAGVALAAAAAALLLVTRGPLGPGPGAAPEEDAWQARAAGQAPVWGVRAFCVSDAGRVEAEAAPGGTLRCGPGAAVQFSATAPVAARLSLVAEGGGEPLHFTPEGGGVSVAAGVDVPLDFSTPVSGAWLSRPLAVSARFTDASGRLLGESRLQLAPRP
jgi:hypothetical protein